MNTMIREMKHVIKSIINFQKRLICKLRDIVRRVAYLLQQKHVERSYHE